MFQEDNRPRIEVTVNPQTVVEGNSATFTFTSDIVMPTDTVIDYIVTGSATAEDDYDDGPLDGSFIFPQGAQAFDLVIQTLTDDEIESEEEIVIEVGDGFGIGENLPYVPGALREARLAITSPPGDFQTIKVSATSVTVNEGSNVSFELSLIHI